MLCSYGCTYTCRKGAKHGVMIVSQDLFSQTENHIMIIISLQLTVQCHEKKVAPCEMCRGSATSNDQFAYFTSWDSLSVYRYEWRTEKWDKLPQCLHYHSTLVIIDGALTAVGGHDKGFFFDAPTNKLMTLRRGQWVEELPPMKTACVNSAVVSISGGEWVLVIGGVGDRRSAVSALQVGNRVWYELTDLPKPLVGLSATICGNHIHVVGDDCYGFSCSLQDLPSSDQPTMSQSKSSTVSWSPLPPLPVTRSTAATLCGQLVIIGGTQGRTDVNSIHQLIDGQWVEIGSLFGGRRWCLVVSPSPDRMMIVGGRRGFSSVLGSGVTTDSVEECVVMQ